jgi:hypothetical protein
MVALGAERTRVKVQARTERDGRIYIVENSYKIV